MKAIAGILRTLVLLAGIWGVLGAVAWLADAIPTPASSAEALANEPGLADANQPGTPPNQPGTARNQLEPLKKAVAALPDPEPEPPGPALVHWGLCAGGGKDPAPDASESAESVAGRGVANPNAEGEPSRETSQSDSGPAKAPAVPSAVKALSLFSQEAMQFVVGCPKHVEVLTLTRPPGASSELPKPQPALERVISLSVRSSTPDTRARLEDAAAADVDGDGRTDLALGFSYRRSNGEPRGGALYLLRREPSGAFGPPDRLAPIAAVDIELLPINRRPGAEIIALNLPSTFQPRPTEAWIFAGGPAPRRKAIVKAGKQGHAVAVADLNQDGHPDLVTLAEDDQLVWLAQGPSGEAFSQARSLGLPDAKQALTTDIDADGSDDVLVIGQTLHAIRAWATEGPKVTVLPLEQPLRWLHAEDFNGDGRTDMLGVTQEGFSLYEQREGFQFEHRALKAPWPAQKVQKFFVGRFDGSNSLDMIALLEAGAKGTQLALWPDFLEDDNANWSEDLQAVADAPLTLSLDLR